MKNLLVLLITLVLADVSIAASKCYSNKEIKGRDAMSKALMKGDPSSFEKFCNDNKGKVTCATQEVGNENVKASTSEMMKGHPCATLVPIKNKDGKNTALYLWDTEKK